MAIRKFSFQGGIAGERRETLEEVMAEMVKATCNRIIEEYRKRGIPSYQLTPENRQAENEITRIYRAVMDGREKLEAYKNACDNWLKAAISTMVEIEGAQGTTLD